MRGFSISGVTSLSFLTLDELIERIECAVKDNIFLHIVVLDLGLFVRSFFNEGLREVLNSADIVLPVGRFFSWGIRKLFFGLRQLELMSLSRSVNRSEEELLLIRERLELAIREFSGEERAHLSVVLMQRLLNNITGFFFIGGSVDDVGLAYKYMKQSFPFVKILGMHSRIQAERYSGAVLEKVKKVDPSVLIVDIGRVKQECWIQENKLFFSKSVCIGLDKELSFLAGREEGLGLCRGSSFLFPFCALYYLGILFLYKTFLRGRLEWVE